MSNLRVDGVDIADAIPESISKFDYIDASIEVDATPRDYVKRGCGAVARFGSKELERVYSEIEIGIVEDIENYLPNEPAVLS